MLDEQEKNRTQFTRTQVLVVRCKACKEVIAIQSLLGAAESLGQFLLDHRDDDMAVSRKVQKIGGGCACPKTTAEAQVPLSACEEKPSE